MVSAVVDLASNSVYVVFDDPTLTDPNHLRLFENSNLVPIAFSDWGISTGPGTANFPAAWGTFGVGDILWLSGWFPGGFINGFPATPT